MITREFAERFANEWIDAWNAHDVERILAHYTADFVMSSPFIALIAGEPSGTLHGKAAVRVYWTAALEGIPDLRFELRQVLVGADSVTIYYQGVRGMVAEVLCFGSGGLVQRAAAHYE